MVVGASWWQVDCTYLHLISAWNWAPHKNGRVRIKSMGIFTAPPAGESVHSCATVAHEICADWRTGAALSMGNIALNAHFDLLRRQLFERARDRARSLCLVRNECMKSALRGPSGGPQLALVS